MIGGDNGSDGNVLKSKGDGTMEWGTIIVNPTFSSFDYPGDDTALDPAGGQSLVINGIGFNPSVTVTIGGTTCSSITRNSSEQLTVTTPAKSAGSQAVVITNTDGGSASTNVSYNGIPAFTNAAGSLGSFKTDESINLSAAATEPDGGAITYAITSGALPSGVTLNTSTGAITGTAPSVSADTTSNFTVTATDDENQSTARAYSITVTPPLPSDDFSVVTYTGNGGTQAITSVGFKPDFVWLKERNGVDSHRLFDTTRGATKRLFSDNNGAESTATDSLTSFDTGGFTVGSSAAVNQNGQDYVAWCWKANGGTTSSNTDGTITSTVQVNEQAGFSIVQGTASGGYPTVNSFGHGLGTTPALIIFKQTNGIAGWPVWHQSFSNTAQDYLNLNLTNAKATSSEVWGNSAPTSSVFSITDGWTLNVGGGFIAYCFAEVEGFSKFGSYTGNAGTLIVETGFEPAFLMIKRTDAATYDWYILDNKRNPQNYRNTILRANSTDADQTVTNGDVDVNFLSNGFSFDDMTSSAGFNASGGTYIYMAFAEDPDTTVPTLADSFNVATYTGNSSTTQSITGVGFKPDFVWQKARSSTYSNFIIDSLRGRNSSLIPNDTYYNNAGSDADKDLISFDSDGMTFGPTQQIYGKVNGTTYVTWNWKASNNQNTINTNGSINSIVSANANAGFSMVKYIGGGGVATIGHGLSAAPEMVIVKSLGHSASWYTYHIGLDGSSPEDYNVRLNETAARQDSASYWNDTAPTNSVFTIGTTTGVSQNNTEFIAYCWHSVSGYSKFGSYVGNATSNRAITGLGFQPNFVMLKNIGATTFWSIFDSSRGGSLALFPNSTQVEANETGVFVSFDSDGFTVNQEPTANGSGNTIIYMAFKIN